MQIPHVEGFQFCSCIMTAFFLPDDNIKTFIGGMAFINYFWYSNSEEV